MGYPTKSFKVRRHKRTMRTIAMAALAGCSFTGSRDPMAQLEEIAGRLSTDVHQRKKLKRNAKRRIWTIPLAKNDGTYMMNVLQRHYTKSWAAKVFLESLGYHV